MKSQCVETCKEKQFKRLSENVYHQRWEELK